MLRPYLVDTHCHLGDAAFDADRDAVLAHAKALGVMHVVVIGESVARSERAVALARRAAGLSATAGVHPHDASSWSDGAGQRVRELLDARETRSEEHTSELQSLAYLVCRLLLEKKKKINRV